MKRLIKRLDKIFDQASYDQRVRGITWYGDAHYIARDLANEFQLPLYKVVGVIAALSPNNKWERNIVDTRLFLTTPSVETKVCTFIPQRRKALRILTEAKDESEVLEILNGRKTQSFYKNIFYFDSNKEVTVDLWMFRAAKLDHSAANYETISQAVLKASEDKKLLPHQYQAIVWSVIRPTK